ncbi:hypothetical protein D910_11838 [Dendroctonus ponderosae]|uniref:DUF5641 domain-containing protein n=1 Tax=Dendroctonus ponderosae TaxID=77166 RepID=U4UWA7_DENPD|nr:hypothetical protein D910_11838 [Dendroctonus ponderosae]
MLAPLFTQLSVNALHVKRISTILKRCVQTSEHNFDHSCRIPEMLEDYQAVASSVQVNTVPYYIIKNLEWRFQMLQQINQSFWKRWSSSYVANLQRRVKWKAKGSTLKLGTMVVLKNDNLPLCRWLLGRIIKVHPGLDGEVRVVSVKTQHGTFKRAITKVCPLPMPSEQCTF